MLGFNSSRAFVSKLFSVISFLFSLLFLQNVYAIEEVYVPGYKDPDQMTGLEFQEYLNNIATADQLRALAQYLAQEAAARAAAAKKKSEDEVKADEQNRCIAVRKADHALCKLDAQGFKRKNNAPCNTLQATVGNIPYGNPAGACYAAVLDAYDEYVASCDFKLAIGELDCL